MDTPDSIDSITISCHACEIEITRNFFVKPLTEEQFKAFKKRDDRTCPYCEKPMAYFAHTLLKKVQSQPRAEKQEEISLEQWQLRLSEKYVNLRQIADKEFPGLWFLLEFEISVHKILNIKDCTLPFILIVLGKPGSLKTLGLELLREWRDTYFVDNYSSKAWVSHSANVKEEKLAEVDMLPKIRNKLFLVSELSPFFAKKYDDLAEGIGIITRIADGHGYKSASGVHGDRGYSGEWMFCWIGAAVDIPRKVHMLLGTLGPKLYFVRLPSVEKTEDDYFNELKKDNHSIKFNRVKESLIDYFKVFDIGPQFVRDKTSNLLKIEWDHDKDDEVALRQIIKLGVLLSHLRAVVPTWETHDTQGTDYAYATAIREQPDRAITQLKNLARGHALSQGRNHIERQDVPVVVKTVLSTASIDRVNVFDLMLKHRGTLTTSQMQSSLNLHEHTAHRTMAELKAVELVNLDEGDFENIEKKITLKTKFKWFKSKEFRQLRQGFVAVDNSSYLPTTKKTAEREAASRNFTHVSCSSYDSDTHKGDFSASVENQKRLNWSCLIRGN